MEIESKEYSNGEITVVWQPKKCIHSKLCWHGLADVFNPRIKPWIDVSKSDSTKIVTQVNQCPSGALSIKETQSQTTEKSTSMSSTPTEITVNKNGPLRIKGSLTIKHKDGREETQNEVYLCRCGQSANKPFCDGAHKKCDFKDE